MKYSKLLLQIIFFTRIFAPVLTQNLIYRVIRCKAQAVARLNGFEGSDGLLGHPHLTVYGDGSLQLRCTANFTYDGQLCYSIATIICSGWQPDFWSHVSITFADS